MRSIRSAKRLIHVDIDKDGDGESDAHYRATGKHPFWTTERGWQFAVDLKLGDKLLDNHVEVVTVIALREEKIVSDTHNLEVEGLHTFYVVDDGVAVLVHNGTILLPGDNGMPFHGGPYGQLGTAGDFSIERHHLLSDAISPIPTGNR